MSTESKLTIDQSVKMSEAINKLSSILQIATSACWGEDVELADFPYLFSYAFGELDILVELQRELEGEIT